MSASARTARWTTPGGAATAGEEVFPGYLRLARAILAARPARLDDEPTGLPPDFEALRWFPLPRACLQGRSARTVEIG